MSKLDAFLYQLTNEALDVIGMAMPEGNRHGPNCGVTAVAIAAGVPFDDVWDFLKPNKHHNWQGMLSLYDILRSLAHFKVKVEPVRCPKVPLRNVAQHLLDNQRYLVLTTGHIQVVHGNIMVDQGGHQLITQGWQSRKYVRGVWKIFDEVPQDLQEAA